MELTEKEFSEVFSAVDGTIEYLTMPKTSDRNGKIIMRLIDAKSILMKKFSEPATPPKTSDANLNIGCVSNGLLAEKIILALDDYGRKTHSAEYGLPIDPDTKDFEDKRPQEMLKIVIDIFNGC